MSCLQEAVRRVLLAKALSLTLLAQGQVTSAKLCVLTGIQAVQPLLVLQLLGPAQMLAQI